MGKKKKRGGGGRRGKGRAAAKDWSSHAGDDQDLLSDELTALSAIFQEDLRVVSESPPIQFVINLRPHSSDMGYDDPDVSALLLVRCLPGYPYKCPKLQVVPEKGLTKDDVNHLLSLLIDQANFNAREGRVMIFNLVEAAQEFLSEIAPVQESHGPVPHSVSGRREQWPDEDVAFLCDRNNSSDGTFVHGSFDLYGDMCESGSWDQGLEMDFVNDDHSRISREKMSVNDKSRRRNISFKLGQGAPQADLFQNHKPGLLPDTKYDAVVQANLTILQEEIDDDSRSISVNSSSKSESVGKGSKGVADEDFAEKDFNLGEQVTKMGPVENVPVPLGSSLVEVVHGDKSENERRDLLLVHLLRVSSASKGSLPYSLTEVTSELYNLGMLSEWAKDLASEPSVFDKAFENAFQQYMNSSPISQFWKASADFNTDNASVLKSRYLNDFEEICSLGRGGFGHVVLCRNKLDGRQYAVKKIRLKDKNLSVNDKILREVATLSRLQHQHVVRYYQAWFETEFGGYHNTWGSMTPDSSSISCMGTSSINAAGTGNRLETAFLYIQMEYCPRTLRQELEAYRGPYDKEVAWHLFRQIVEGLVHIHGQGIIHRDLTPSNIFFDARNDIKIGDFGLAKFSKLEQLEQDQMFPNEATGIPMDGTGQVGTLFYTAPEIEQGWPQVNEKVDMYSLGVVFFELWHPFTTAMERYVVLSELKQKGTPPAVWVSEFPEQASLVQRLMSPSPSDRLTAMEILRHELPPRMEDEWLYDILRTIQTSEDSYVYDRVVSAIFDEDRILMKSHRQHSERSKVNQEISSFRQYSELASELRDNIIEISKEVFTVHGAKKLEIAPICLYDGYHPFNRRNTVKLLTSGGNMLELCHELRSPFVSWVITNQKVNFKRYEISWVHRKAIGHSTPNRFLQGDFDIIGGAPTVTVSEILKVVMDIVSRFFHPDDFDIRLNHAQILEAIWSWVGIENKLRQNVAELLSFMCSSSPQSASRKSIWGFIRRRLLQDHNLTETAVDRLHGVDLRFCGSADQALARLRGALSSEHARRALEELSDLLSYLRIWKIENHVSLDVLMPPEESYYRGLFFQIYLIKENNQGSVSERTLFAVGGCYDHLLHQMWHHKLKPPCAVGVSIALEKILHHPSVEIRPSRNEPTFTVLICSKGGGGMLEERMELVAELWQANMKAEFVPLSDPSLMLQYEYAYEHDIKCLVIITSSFSQTGPVKVRHLELKKEKEIERKNLIKFLSDISSQFRNPSVWN